MNRHLTPIDISNNPELLRLAEEVGRHIDYCVTMYDEETLNPVQTQLPGFSEMCRYTRFGMASEVAATKTPRILKRDREPVAMLMPVGTVVARRNPQRRAIWTHYDPKRVRAVLKTSVEALQGVDRGELFSDLANQRRQESTGRHF